MGGKCPHRKVKKRRLSHKTARRGKFLLNADDAVYDELVKLADKGKDCEGKDLPVDEDLPGMGQFYCLHCEYASLALPLRFDFLPKHNHNIKSGSPTKPM
jgi:bud site selection protein 20